MKANELADLLEHGAYPVGTREQAAAMLRQQQAEIEALKANLDFIAGVNRLGLGVQKVGGLSSEEIEKIWLSIKEQRDDNFHYGWKKCEQYYGIRKAQE
jgi:hypothetical protein